MIDRYRRWFEYEKDSHAKTLASLNATPEDLRDSEGFRRAVYLMGHIRNTIEEILTQLFGHSWYHRGQIAQLLRAIAAEPAVTDFVFWARQPVNTGGA